MKTKKIKKITLSLLLVIFCFTGMLVEAKIGSVIGKALHTDIVAYINNYAVPSYAVNGQSVIVAEDLTKFGFDVVWDSATRQLKISRNSKTSVEEMSVKKTGVSGSKYTDILETDIKVYANGKQITSYAMNGYTMIPLEELTMFGNVYWVQAERAVKLWVDGLHIRQTMQSVSQYVTYGTSTGRYQSKAYGSVTGLITWQYNKYVGTKPDTGADVLLVQTNHVPTSHDAANLLLFSNIGDDAMYKTEVDGSGNFYIDNVPTGEYYIMIKSKNTNESPSIQDINISLARSYLKGKFSEEGLKNLELNINLYSFEIKKITVEANRTVRISKDWGYTYI